MFGGLTFDVTSNSAWFQLSKGCVAATVRAPYTQQPVFVKVCPLE